MCVEVWESITYLKRNIVDIYTNKLYGDLQKGTEYIKVIGPRYRLGVQIIKMISALKGAMVKRLARKNCYYI